MKKTNGIILVNKPVNYTSRDVVNIISRNLGIKKVGHTGTLDPMATGVMLVLFGKYTKLVDTLTCWDKEYIAEIRLGIQTDTLDRTGIVEEKKDFKVTKESILKVFSSFIGKYKMEVPKYSAIKVKGKKLYEYARNNEDVVMPVKDAQIYSLELLDYKNDIIKFRAHVSKGTYIRSLIRDICIKLGTIGVMESLVRIKQGKFKLEDANNIDDIKNNSFKILDVFDVLENVGVYNLKKDEYFKVKNGNKINLVKDNNYLLMKYLGNRVALYIKDEEIYRPLIMY